MTEIPLAVRRHSADLDQSARRGEPVTFGVPLPRGAARDGESWQIVDERSQVVAVQVRPLELWPDGSIRWLLVDGQIDVAADDTGERRLVGGAAQRAAAPEEQLSIQQTEAGVIVDTNAARFTITSGHAGLFSGVEVGGSAVLDPRASGIRITDAAGAEHPTVVTAVSIIDRGVLRARASVDLAVGRGPLSDLELQATMDFYAGLPTVRLAVRLRNPRAARHPGGFWDLGDPGSLLVKDVSVRWALPPSVQTSLISASIEPGMAWTAFGLPFELYQDSSGGENWQSPNHVNRDRRIPNRFRGYQLESGGDRRSGLRATPLVRLGPEGGAIGVALPHFWQNFPKAVNADSHSLSLGLFPRQYDDLHELQGGEQKTHVCYVSFAQDRVTDPPLEWCRTPVVIHADPAWHLSAGAVQWLSHDDPDHAALVATAIEGPDSFERKREVVDEYGWRNFGDVYGDHEAVRHKGSVPLVSHYNNQYDPIAGFLYQYFRTGDVRWWTMADELARHVIDIDVYHTDRDKWAYNHGLFWHTYHYGDADTATHRIYPKSARGVAHGGGPSPDHNYTTGLMLHFLLTGHEASRQTVAGLAKFVVDADDGAKTVLRWLSRAPTGYATASGSYAYHGPGRGPGNSLNALVDGHRLTGDAALLEKAEEIIRRVVHPTEDIARHRLDDPENKWFYLMFLQSLGKYVWRKAELGQLDLMYDYGRATLLHYARWMAEHEYPYLEKPERLEFPTETWAAHEVRKSDILCVAALHASGDERGRFIERGRFFFRNAVETLRQMPTRTLARPVIILLSSGLVQPWLAGHPDAIADPAERPSRVFPPQAPFVPQKQVAKRRLLILAAMGGTIALAGLAALVWWWLRA